jgi:hypothetical protein
MFAVAYESSMFAVATESNMFAVATESNMFAVARLGYRVRPVLTRNYTCAPGCGQLATHANRCFGHNVQAPQEEGAIRSIRMLHMDAGLTSHKTADPQLMGTVQGVPVVFNGS